MVADRPDPDMLEGEGGARDGRRMARAITPREAGKRWTAMAVEARLREAALRVLPPARRAAAARLDAQPGG